MNIQMEMLFFYHTVVIFLLNNLINIFYGLASSPDPIKEGEPVQNHLISILLLFDIFA